MSAKLFLIGLLLLIGLTVAQEESGAPAGNENGDGATSNTEGNGPEPAVNPPNSDAVQPDDNGAGTANENGENGGEGGSEANGGAANNGDEGVTPKSETETATEAAPKATEKPVHPQFGHCEEDAADAVYQECKNQHIPSLVGEVSYSALEDPFSVWTEDYCDNSDKLAAFLDCASTAMHSKCNLTSDAEHLRIHKTAIENLCTEKNGMYDVFNETQKTSVEDCLTKKKADIEKCLMDYTKNMDSESIENLCTIRLKYVGCSKMADECVEDKALFSAFAKARLPEGCDDGNTGISLSATLSVVTMALVAAFAN